MSETADGKQKVKVTVKKISPLFIEGKKRKECVLCRNSLDEPCNHCVEVHNKACPSVQGKCGHEFHEHCIKEWLKNGHNNCPGCGTLWENN